jgi:alpha-beta hydrolase superfamily lysophospholipase
VLSAPALGDTFPRWLRAGSRLLAGVLPRVSVRDRLPESGLSRDPSVAAAVAADPLNQTAATIRFGAEAFAAQDRLAARLATLEHLPCPTYVLHGADDPIVPASATDVLGRFPEVTRVVYPGLRHECHNEPEGEAVVDAIVDWLRESAAAVRSTQSKIASGERTSAESVASPQTRGT